MYIWSYKNVFATDNLHEFALYFIIFQAWIVKKKLDQWELYMLYM